MGRLALAAGGCSLIALAVWLSFAPPLTDGHEESIFDRVEQVVDPALMDTYSNTRVVPKRNGVRREIWRQYRRRTSLPK